jgi:hypothetical protein
MVRQRGRLLIRLDALEHQITQSGRGSLNGHLAAHPGELPILAQGPRPQQPAGLAVGTPLDRFRLPELGGKYVSLQDFAGKRVLLVHWSPQCGFCDLIAPELAMPDSAAVGIGPREGVQQPGHAGRLSPRRAGACRLSAGGGARPRARAGTRSRSRLGLDEAAARGPAVK